MDALAEFFKILSDKNRLRILGLLSNRKMCVCELAYVLQVTQPSISRHLKRMKKNGLIEDEQDGFWTNYYLNPKEAKSKLILSHLKKWFKEDDKLQHDLRALENVDRAELCIRK